MHRYRSANPLPQLVEAGIYGRPGGEASERKNDVARNVASFWTTLGDVYGGVARCLSFLVARLSRGIILSSLIL
jgi:hypothetical protein